MCPPWAYHDGILDGGGVDGGPEVLSMVNDSPTNRSWAAVGAADEL